MQHGAGGKEQQTLEHGVVHGVEKSCGHSERGRQSRRREHIAYLGNAVEGKQTLEVMLRQRHGDADEHTDAADKHKQKLHCAKSHALEQEVGKTDDAVNTGLCEHAGDEHRDGGRSRAVRIRRQRMEGHDKGLGAEADKEQGKGKLCGIIEISGDECGELGEVQGMHLSVEHYRADQYAGRADAADDKVLKRCLKRTVRGISKRGERDGGKGEYLDHDEHIEDITREDKTHNAACEHEKQGIILRDVVVMAHVLEGVDAGDEHCR